MQSVSPVFTEKEQPTEIIVAKEQAEYATAIGIPVAMLLIDKESGRQKVISPWGTAFRFELDEEERAAIAAGADLVLTQLNFDGPITPMNIQCCMRGEKPSLGMDTPELLNLPSVAVENKDAPGKVVEISSAVDGANKGTDSPSIN